MTEEEKELTRKESLAFYDLFKRQVEDMFEACGFKDAGIKDMFGILAYGIADEFYSFDKNYQNEGEIHALLVVINHDECTAKVHAVLK